MKCTGFKIKRNGDEMCKQKQNELITDIDFYKKLIISDAKFRSMIKYIIEVDNIYDLDFIANEVLFTCLNKSLYPSKALIFNVLMSISRQTTKNTTVALDDNFNLNYESDLDGKIFCEELLNRLKEHDINLYNLVYFKYILGYSISYIAKKEKTNRWTIGKDLKKALEFLKKQN